MNVKREPKSAIAKNAAVLEAGLVLSRHADEWRIYDIRYGDRDDGWRLGSVLAEAIEEEIP
ncbi:hypothetical protein GCM10010869_45330 [Mesorhizobium tianshanense]|uniref:Uncharacterized protein n=1 Tax=Mesorhizobium tianshanense TaxID=39844 RepID=A0A562NKI7_9HYPH|nr:hypothetical protein [Mesorhizobium tianshanense]TWI32719.1 hypothetical protein IQ26_04389 [Mesorhizobium tianshanense]GLS38936.1 hypothetical protein GCM10010869_45330 [Mesorhizobium tianshanense]